MFGDFNKLGELEGYIKSQRLFSSLGLVLIAGGGHMIIVNKACMVGHGAAEAQNSGTGLE